MSQRAYNIIKSSDDFYLIDSIGNKYLDCTENASRSILGYGNCTIEKVIIDKLHRGIISQPSFCNNHQIDQFRNRLTEITKLHAILCDEKSDALNFALECTEQYSKGFKNTTHNEIIIISKNNNSPRSCTDIYLNKYDKPLKLRTLNISNIRDIIQNITNDTIGIIVEIANTAFDLSFCDAHLLEQIQATCAAKNITFIINEMNIGIGCTGKVFAYQQYNNIDPNIVLCGNTFGSGMSMNAVLISDKIYKATVASDINNLLYNTMAAGIADVVLSHVNDTALLDNIYFLGIVLKDKLNELKHKYPNIINTVVGFGLIAGIKLHNDIDVEIFGKYLKENMLLVDVIESNNIIKLSLPLNITEEHISEAISIIDHTIPQIAILSM